MPCAWCWSKDRKKFVVSTYSKHHRPIAPDLVQRRFYPAAPNKVWGGDTNYLPTDEGLATVQDLHSRQMGWSLQPHMHTVLVKDALLMACFRREPADGLIFHSDRGSQYCSRDVQDALQAWDIRSSRSRKGNCWGNAAHRKSVGAAEDCLRFSALRLAHGRFGQELRVWSEPAARDIWKSSAYNGRLVRHRSTRSLC